MVGRSGWRHTAALDRPIRNGDPGAWWPPPPGRGSNPPLPHRLGALSQRPRVGPGQERRGELAQTVAAAPLTREELVARVEPVPRVRFAHLPTPLEEMPRLREALGADAP